ncbi:hypothetical protein AAL_08208 [Moelleriella libera RCEF 2490]|uniref:Uncharacterized protein n=1 Tax=Moelleriella libera RCEF 2490 TaxID=1081109 RepID=A0A162I3C3_9HYPO|nr:hypothetical protein AAL_08208 [Moelleriella libera RCEF 2490]
MADLDQIIRGSERRIQECVNRRNGVMVNLGKIDTELAESNRVLATMQQNLATAHVTRPRTRELDAETGRLAAECRIFRETLATLAATKTACLNHLSDLDEQLATERRILQAAQRARR